MHTNAPRSGRRSASTMSGAARLTFVIAIGLMPVSSLVRGQAAVPLPPTDIVRGTGAPSTSRFAFAGDPVPTYSLCVDNRGVDDRYHPVTSAWVVLNGQTILQPGDFHQRTTQLARTVRLQSSNVLEVRPAGRPGSGLTIWVALGTSCGYPTPQNRPPAFTSAAIATATLLEAYRYPVTASDPDGDPTTFALLTGPPGMTMDATTGEITWLPTGTGSVSVMVAVMDNRGGQATQSFQLAISRAANRPPDLQPVPTKAIPVGLPFRLGLIAVDPDPGDTLTYGLVGGPLGAAVGPSGVLDWTPRSSQIGSHAIIASVMDQAGAGDTLAFTLEVADTPAPPVIGPQPDANLQAGTGLVRTVLATDPNPGDVITLAVSAGPPGMSLTGAGLLTWTPGPGDLGRHDVTLRATDSAGLWAGTSFVVVVEPVAGAAPPTAVDDRFGASRGPALSVAAPGVVANDLDPASLPLTATLVTPPGKGTLTLLPGGGFDYTAAAAQPGSTEPRLARSRTNPLASTTRTHPVAGDVDGDGVAEVVILESGAFAYRRLVALRGSDLTPVYEVDVYRPADTPPLVVALDTDVALGDLDDDGQLETIAISEVPLRRALVAIGHDGALRWTSDDLVDGVDVLSSSGAVKPVLADLDHDGQPEIVVGHVARWSATPAGVAGADRNNGFNRNGQRLWHARAPGLSTLNPTIGNLVVADLNLDGCSEILFSNDVFDCRGVHQWSRVTTQIFPEVAVANLDDDPFGEVLFLNNFHWLYAYEHTGALKWSREIPSNGFSGGGITIGDADGDGASEILIVREDIEILDRNGVLERTISLNVPVQQVWGQGGNTTIFDLNADGRPEVLFMGAVGPFDDALRKGALYVFDGASGGLLHTLQATRTVNSRSRYRGPIVADVDGDGSADIVTGGWDDSTTLRVFSAAQGAWARTRPIWHQTSYHVTNIGSDGVVPAWEPAHRLTPGHNTERVNLPLPGEASSDVDQFTYRVSNGQASSNVATVRIDLLPDNGAPRIVSTAPVAASPDLAWVYGVSAVDPDPGDVLTFGLLQGPAGMTIGPATGLVRWTPPPDASGVAQGIVRVTDAAGLTDSQMFFVTLGPPVAVPDLTGLTEADALTAVGSAGLTPGAVVRAPSSTVPAGIVISHEPAGGAHAPAGASVSLVVSSGPIPVVVPNLVGDTERGARQRLASGGLDSMVTRAFSNTVADGIVIGQSPAPGTMLAAGAVTVTVSAGSGLRLRVPQSTTPAGLVLPLTVTAYDLNYQDTAPPAVNLSVAPTLLPYFGGLPVAVPGMLTTGMDTRGAFRVTAVDPATGRRAAADFAVTHPRPVVVRAMNDVYTDLTQAMADIDDLARQGRAALAAGDDAAIRSLLQQMVVRWRQVDLRELSLATPFGLQAGFFPTLQDLPGLGLTPTPDDLFAQTVLTEAVADLDAWVTGLREATTPMSELTVLARRFKTRAARLNGLTISEWGVIRAQSAITALASDRAAQLYDAIMADVAAALARPAPAGPDGAIGIEASMSTLGEQLVRTAMEYVVEELIEAASETVRNVKQVVADTMKFAAFGAATVAAARHFRDFVQATDITAVVAGASLSFRFFEKEFSFIEADVDLEQPSNTIVIAVGPDVIGPVSDTIEGVKDVWKYRRDLNPTDPDDGKARSAEDLFAALKGLYNDLKALGDVAQGNVDAARKAFQPQAEVLRGCVFTTAPTCGQLFYRDGLTSVYHYTPPPIPGFQDFQGFPVPILFMIYDRTTGGMSIETPVFFPTAASTTP